MVEDAEAQYLAFFASKTVVMIRAPDSYVYPAPFNLIELVFIAPFEYVSFCLVNSGRLTTTMKDFPDEPAELCHGNQISTDWPELFAN